MSAKTRRNYYALENLPAVALRMAVARRQGELDDVTWKWRDVQARPEQVLPAGDWSVWLVQAGRGWGKTRTGAEATRELVEKRIARRLALIGTTSADVRDIMVEGPSGILAISPPSTRPRYEPSKRRLTWPNGAVATTYSAEEPEQLRGPEFDFAWADELAKWSFGQACWTNLTFALRLGEHPRVVATTTPKPVNLIRQLVADPATVVTRGGTYDNAANLAPRFLSEIRRLYEGTRTGRQEIAGELLEDVEGALWRRAWIDDARVPALPHGVELTRVVVGVDPSGGESAGAAQQGMAVAGRGSDGDFYVLEGIGVRLSPAGWARRAVDLYREHRADRIVAERNYGGAMVKSTLRAVDADVPLTIVDATRGKVARAEPIASLYEQGRVHHVGALDELEDQLCAFPVGDGLKDMVDALVWALTDLQERRRLRAV